MATKKEEKNLDEKNKKNKPMKIISTFFFILLFLAGGFLIYNLYFISDIEPTLIYIGMGILFLFNIITIIILKAIIKKKSVIRYIIFFILALILIAAQATVGYYVFKAYKAIDTITSDKVTYESAVVVLTESKLKTLADLKDKKIGIVKDEKSIHYILGKEIIDKNKLDTTSTIIEYEEPIELVNDLYAKKIDAIIIQGTYTSMFTSIEEYEKINDETKVIASEKKTMTKEEEAKYTGEEISNYNQTNSVNEPFTVLVMGVDATGTDIKGASGNGDALMLVTFNPKTLNATILSIPRDTYTYITCMGKENKITHAAWGGESCMKATIEKMTGIKIDYYFKINFYGVVKLVDALGGIELTIPDKMHGVCEQNSERSWDKNKIICFKKGTHNVSGEEALAYARHRKTLLTGDFERGSHQQEVVQGIINKIKAIKSASQALEILDKISKSMDTNFTTKQLLSFYDIAKAIVATSNSDNLINMQHTYLTGSGQMIFDERAGMVLYNFIYNKGSLDQIVNVMKANLGLKSTSQIKTMDFSIQDKFELGIVGKNPGTGTNTYTLLPSFVGSSRSYTISWLASHGISYTITEKEVTTGTNDTVLAQSLPAKKRVDLINKSAGITITVAKVKAVVTPDPEEPEDPDDGQGGQTNP